MSDRTSDYDSDSVRPRRTPPLKKRHTTWNDILIATHRTVHPEGYRSITMPPPPGFPDPNDIKDYVSVSYLRLLSEFQHWNIYGWDVIKRDLALLDSGRMSLMDMFERGPVTKVFYDHLEQAEDAKSQAGLEKLGEVLGRCIEQLHHDYVRTDDKEQGEQILRELANCRAAEQALRARDATVTAVDPDQVRFHRRAQSEAQGNPLNRRDRTSGRPRAASEANSHNPHRPSRVQDTPTSPHTIPRRSHTYAPPPKVHNHDHPSSSSRANPRPTFDDLVTDYQCTSARIAAESRSRPLHAQQHGTTNVIRGSTLYNPPSAMRYWRLDQDVRALCKELRTTPWAFMLHLEIDARRLQLAADDYRQCYERLQAEMEKNGGVGGPGDV